MGLAIPNGPWRSWWPGGPWFLPSQGPFPAWGITPPLQMVPPATIVTPPLVRCLPPTVQIVSPPVRIGVPPDGLSRVPSGPDRLGPALTNRLSTASWTILSILARSPMVAVGLPWAGPNIAPLFTGPTCRTAIAWRPAPPSGVLAASQQATVSAAFWRLSGRHTVSNALASVPSIARRKWSSASSSRNSGGMLACAIPTKRRMSCANSPSGSWERRLRPLS